MVVSVGQVRPERERPDYAEERRQGAPLSRVAGVDEVGRGCLAGPVLACAVVLDPAALPPALVGAIDDSKRVAKRRREHIADLCAEIAARDPAALSVGHGSASVAEIGAFDILRASLLAMQRAVADLGAVPAHVLVDGDRAPDFGCPATALVGGDRRSLSIACAAILAKVRRDRLMTAAAVSFPGWGFERHVGYGTAAHRAILAARGPTPLHRPGFAPVEAARRAHAGGA